jgi:hypothetical protein
VECPSICNVEGVNDSTLALCPNCEPMRMVIRLIEFAPAARFEEAVTMSDHADPVPGPQSSNEEPQAHLTLTPRGGG